MVGRTHGDQIVVFDGEASMKGRIVDLDIIDARSLTLFGKLSSPTTDASDSAYGIPPIAFETFPATLAARR